MTVFMNGGVQKLIKWNDRTRTIELKSVGNAIIVGVKKCSRKIRDWIILILSKCVADWGKRKTIAEKDRNTEVY